MPFAVGFCASVVVLCASSFVGSALGRWAVPSAVGFCPSWLGSVLRCWVLPSIVGLCLPLSAVRCLSFVVCRLSVVCLPFVVVRVCPSPSSVSVVCGNTQVTCHVGVPSCGQRHHNVF